MTKSSTCGMNRSFELDNHGILKPNEEEDEKMGTTASDKRCARTYSLKLNRNTDAELIAKLDSVDSIQGYIKELIRRDITMKKNEINYLNRHSEELFEGHKLTAYGKVFWANMTTREIYAHSEDAEIAGVINGYKVAEITEDWQII